MSDGREIAADPAAIGEPELEPDPVVVEDRVATVGRVEAIWVKRAHGGTMDVAERATLAADKGIVGNADQGGRRQVTIIEKEVWDSVTSGLGVTLDPSTRRANVMVSGLRLANSRGKVMSIGGVRLHIVNETVPCNLMDEAHHGLQDALRPDWGGGAYGYVVGDGEIVVGDEVRWADEATS